MASAVGLLGAKTSIPTEILAGVATFLTMAYILAVQPTILATDFAGKPTGLSWDGVFVATALASGVISIAMGLFARLPIGLAPGMGQNFVFVGLVMALAAHGAPTPWRAALGVVFWAGALFFLLSLLPIRQALLDVLSKSQKHAIGVGIGLLIAIVGLRNASLLHPKELHLQTEAKFFVDQGVFLVGLFVTAACTARKLPGGIVLGMIASAAVAWWAQKLKMPTEWVGWSPHAWDGLGQLDLVTPLSWKFWPHIAVLLVVITLDATGTLIALTEMAGLSKDGKLPQAREALLVDSAGSVVGACLGTSTLTAYVESAAGVEQGGRTGLTAIVVGVLFLLCLPYAPAIKVLGGYPPLTSAALVVVGALMARGVKEIEWDDFTEALPAFLMIVGIPATFSIGDGLALGIVSYPIVKLLDGRFRGVHWFYYPLAASMVLYFVYGRAGMTG